MIFRAGWLPPVAVFAASATLSMSAAAQWNPSQGQWGKDDPDDLRVMTWNVEDTLASSTPKQTGVNGWTGLSVIIAAMKPDVLILQETGDNDSGVDSISNLQSTINMLLRGGTDFFNGNEEITAWVQKFDPDYDLPHVFVSSETDGFNRNVVLSRFPFVDLNGDGQAVMSDIPFIGADKYAPGGDGQIRGFMFAEIDLPDEAYAGDLVIGNAHLKAFSDSSSMLQRITAAKNVAYYIDHFYYGAGSQTPDPEDNIPGSDLADSILNPPDAVVIGGDWNEDEATNGRRGPAAWLTEAELAGGTDGVDLDRTDSKFDNAVEPFSGSTDTRGGSKLDYLAWSDSTATLRRAWIFSSELNSAWRPPEFIGNGLFSTFQLSSTTSDHYPVLVDLILEEALAPCPGDLDGSSLVDGADLGQLLLAWSPEADSAPGSPADLNGDNRIDGADLGQLLLAWGPCP